MKKLILFAFLFASFSVSAQDIIYKPDGSKIQAKVVEITSTEVKYKSFSNPDGPLYSVGKNELLMVVYQNGEHEVFANSSLTTGSASKTDSLKYNFGRNFIAYNLFDVLFKSVTLSYEHILPNGYLGFRVPFTLSFNDSYSNGFNYYGDVRKIFSTGLDINFYPAGQGRIKYFMGPSFQTGLIEYQYYTYYNDPVNGYFHTVVSKQQGMFYAGLINNGILFQPTRNMNIAVVLGLGLQQYDRKKVPDYMEQYATFAINMGFKF